MVCDVTSSPICAGSGRPRSLVRVAPATVGKWRARLVPTTPGAIKARLARPAGSFTQHRGLEAAGAVVVDVEIADLDEHCRTARGSAPGSLQAAWSRYLSRGAAPGDKVLTIEELMASGKLATPDASGRRRPTCWAAPCSLARVYWGSGGAEYDGTQDFPIPGPVGMQIRVGLRWIR